MTTQTRQTVIDGQLVTVTVYPSQDSKPQAVRSTCKAKYRSRPAHMWRKGGKRG